MFEPTLQRPTDGGADHRRAQDPSQDGATLRAIRWSDLSARLAAARELRAQLRRETDAAMARFIDTAAGLMVAPQPQSPPQSPPAPTNGKRLVNPELSEHRKAYGPIRGKGLNPLVTSTSPAGRQES